jgi:nitrogen fixation protein FixH
VNAKKKQERMRIESRDTIGKLETTEHDADDMAKATIELARSVGDMNDKELQIATDLAHDDLCKANDELEEALMNREMQSMRLTVMEYEQVRRMLCSE